MSDHIGEQFVVVRGRALLLTGALSIVLFGITTAWSQQPARTPRPPSPSTAPSQQVAPPAAEPAPESAPRSNPGLVEEIGRILKDSASGLTSRLPAPGEALGGLSSGTKDAADSLKRMAPLSGQSMVTGRIICPAAANGAPDCKTAADQLCKEKGYKDGRGVDIESTQKCSAKSYFTGQGACLTENFVTRAVCQ